MHIVKPNSQHQALMEALRAAYREHTVNPDQTDKMPVHEAFAVLCQMLGQIIALMDQRRGKDYWVQTMIVNIEQGNAAAIETLMAQFNKDTTEQ